MTEEKIDRINALAHKQQAVGLTEEEKEEQAESEAFSEESSELSE